MLPQDRWEKLKTMVGRIKEMREADPEAMDRKELESLRGGLIYCARTYRMLNPYLKRLHLTIDGWRPFWDVWG